VDLVSGGTYEITTKLRDRQTTKFDNYLRIYQPLQLAEGTYRCTPVSSMDGPVQDRNITRSWLLCVSIIIVDWYILSAVTDYFIEMHTVGDSGYITCTLNSLSGYVMYTWYNEDGNAIVNGDQLNYAANDSIHHKSFMCSGLSLRTFDTRALYIKFAINGNGISVIITS
jgi:hypothetical protein